MANDQKGEMDVHCSFCGKSQDEVRKLIAGPAVYICDECIGLCDEIVREDRLQELEAEREGSILKPKEINQFLDEYV